MNTTDARARVLIIEDDPDFGGLLAELLEMSGFVTTNVADGRAALHELEDNERPDVIMLDLMMPTMDGWQFRREQQRRSDLAAIPVIVMSADGNVGRKAREIDAEGFITKPPHIAILLRELHRVTARGGARA